MLSDCLVFHTSGGISSSPAAFLFLIFLSTELSSSCVNCPNLMSNCLLIILVIGLYVTFRGFSSKFSKCCFHSGIRSSWLVAFILASHSIDTPNKSSGISTFSRYSHSFFYLGVSECCNGSRKSVSQGLGVLTQALLFLVSCAFPSISPSFSPSNCNKTFKRAHQLTHSERITCSSRHHAFLCLQDLERICIRAN